MVSIVHHATFTEEELSPVYVCVPRKWVPLSCWIHKKKLPRTLSGRGANTLRNYPERTSAGWLWGDRNVMLRAGCKRKKEQKQTQGKVSGEEERKQMVIKVITTNKNVKILGGLASRGGERKHQLTRKQEDGLGETRRGEDEI